MSALVLFQYAEVRSYCGWDSYGRWEDVLTLATPLLQPVAYGAGFLACWAVYGWLARRFQWERRYGPPDRRQP